MTQGAVKTTGKRSRAVSAKKKAILSAALDTFSQFGFHGTRLEQIAELAGVSKTNLLYYFPSKEALYIAVATDTGCFKFSNTTPLAHRIAADAIEAGLDFLPHNRTFFEAKSKTRFRIERKMFDDMIFSDNGEICCSWLDRAWLNEIGATDDDLDNLSTLTMSLEGVRCGIILTQNKKDKAYKVSVRSHRPADASRICQNFGGGGHPRAAGCTVDLPAEEACRALMAAAAEELAKW